MHEDPQSISTPVGEVKPYVPAETTMKELTLKALLLGVLMAAVLGAANAYLGLKAGLTVSATFPAAVVAMAALRFFKGTILEENVARTTASVGEALVAGAIFTIPAFLMVGIWETFNYWESVMIMLVGGVLGVLLIIFLRKPLVEEATYLTKFGSKVYVVHRRDQLRASKIMQDRLFKHPKVEMVWNTVVEDVLGNDVVSGVRLKDMKTNQTRELGCGGLFYAIGHEPNTKIFQGQLKMAPDGYLITEPGTTKTSIVGVFACGDCQDRLYRQAVTAAGSGCMAALDAERWLSTHHLE